ncbi:hypothetical protein [Janibacter sp. G368]|uniref:hypothetical protein n=1 Tax=Janibacter sp. G368 TaxID=3420441 RepID=UPI003D005E59
MTPFPRPLRRARTITAAALGAGALAAGSIGLGLAQTLDPTVSAATTSSTGPGTTDSSTDTGTSDGFGTVQQVGPGRQMGVDSTTRAS